MKYESGRSLDDQPLAAYGGGGIDLSADDEARIDDVPADDSSLDPPDVDPAPPGAFAHATVADEPFDDSREKPAADNPALVAVEGLALVATRGVNLLRTSRIAAGAAFAGVIAVGLLLLLGGNSHPGAASADASPSAPPVVVASHEPGNATLVLTGKVEQSLVLAGMTGAGVPDSPIAVTWTDTTTSSLSLEGAVDRGTRTTHESLVLHFTITVNKKPVTFTSDDGECTIGMAVNPANVSGTFSCKKLTSDDGKYVVGATGSYRT